MYPQIIPLNIGYLHADSFVYQPIEIIGCARSHSRFYPTRTMLKSFKNESADEEIGHCMLAFFFNINPVPAIYGKIECRDLHDNIKKHLSLSNPS